MSRSHEGKSRILSISTQDVIRLYPKLARRRWRRLGQVDAGVEDVSLLCLLVLGQHYRQAFLLVAVLARKKTDCSLALLIFNVAHTTLLVWDPPGCFHAIV